MDYTNNGIQQIGIGVTNLYSAWKWYFNAFGFNVKVFEDNSVAELMLPYTGGVPQKRHAALTVNMAGGGGLEIWQYTNRTPKQPTFALQLGDLGIFAAKIKCRNINKAYNHLNAMGASLGGISLSPGGYNHFYVTDPFGNIFDMVECNQTWFGRKNANIGGTYGATIGVSNIEKSFPIYRDILGFDKVLYDSSGIFNDFEPIPGGLNHFRRVIITHSKPKTGAFSQLFGEAQLELVEVKDRIPSKIFENRFWGDPGFIHLCFDISNMRALENKCINTSSPFTVNSSVKHNEKGSFDMGEAAGHFSYIEDRDGTLIEFVETHRVPILKKLNLYINLSKRNSNKPLPKWVVALLGIKKVKF
jgi:catechol 2,3-dioxygenase-like lactoylglutathione lyase family enzyme